ncbi:MAG: hypothetical protein JXN59_02925 [Anaerolineae bacterium]|nr:hypothetical protein [Anaerolineae bacterium]
MTDSVARVSGVNYNAAAMRRLPVDVEHLGIRVVVPLLAIGGFFVTLWVVPIVLGVLGLQQTVLGSLVLPLAVGGAIGAAFLGDRLLKQRWSSGREILLDEHYLILRDQKQPEKVVSWGARVNMLTWRFVVSRRGRIPKGYHCLALQLLQDDEQITIYTFCEPKKLELVNDSDAFTLLAARSVVQDERLNLRVAGQQRRLLQAEDERWQAGAELTFEDFLALWDHIGQQQVAQVT